MNILYFCQLYPPALYGGGEYIFFQWAKELVKRGHKVFAITQRLEGTRSFEEIEGIQVYRVKPVIRYKGTLPTGIFENIEYLINAAVKGLVLIAKNKVDVIHSNTYVPALAGQSCAIIFRKPHIITFHDVFSHLAKDFMDRLSSQYDSSVKVVAPVVEKVVLRCPATVFHAVSNTTKEDMLSCGVRKRIVVIPNAINLEGYATENMNITPENPQMIYIGRLVFYKNLETVIEAFKEVLSKNPDAKFIIVGNGPSKKYLEHKVSEAGLTNIFFTGWISHIKKLKLLKQSSFLVLPSVFEGFGIVVLEAYACGKTVIVSKIMPLTEIVENGVDGLTVPPFDTKAWANAMIYLINNPNDAHNMGKRGLKKVMQSYNIQAVVDELEKLYLNIIHQ